MMSSLQSRLLLATSLLAIAAVAAVAVAARQGTRREFVKFSEELRTLAAESDRTDPAAVAALLDTRCCTDAVLAEAASRLRAREVLAVVADSREVATAAGDVAARLDDLRVSQSGDVITLDGLRDDSPARERLILQYKVPGVPLTLADGRPARLYVVSIPAADAAPVGAFLKSVDRRLVVATALVGLLAIGATWLVARHTLRPIRELQAATASVARGDLTARVGISGTDEVSQLAAGFNAMAAELQRQQELRHNLVHDVVHELRTPITALRCRLESIVDGVAPDPRHALQGASEEVVQLGRLVDDLHEVALAEARELRLAPEDVRVKRLLESAVRGAALETDARVRVDADPGLVVRADPVRTRQVVMNLLTNAARHTPAGGAIALRATGRSDQVAIEVHNTGSTLSDEQLAHVFDRFYRADPSRQRATGGTGLGLAIVKNLVEAQGGRVWAHREADGLTFGFALPAPP